mmetsp:Transcript_42243/g.105222  ORF Transcript_42243/g.105222 Transcript_42243/m.105222 type:complete len:603 (-) Transcript_42243:344-2152(-)
MASLSIPSHDHPPAPAPAPPEDAGFELFSTRRPRDVFAGASSGLKSLTKGLFGGVSSLIVAPVLGAQQNGLPGFCQGLAQGLMGALALPVAGVAVATLQVGRGIINTPEAFFEQVNGKDWDNETRSWYEYNLQTETDKVRNLSEFDHAADVPSQQSSRRSRAGVSVADTEYYDLLGVPSDATSDMIKKSYYKKALKLHPDKNPDNEEAKEQFQKLSQAYQVLADEQTRHKYDQHGVKVVEGKGAVDAGVFFTMLFGSERFEPYIGTLALASMASMEGQLSMRRMQVRQLKREVELANNLVRLIQPLLEEGANMEKVEADLKKEAAELAGLSFGNCLLFVVAELYITRAQEYVGVKSFLQIDAHLAALNSKRLSFQNHTDAVSAGIKAASAALRTFKTVRELVDQNQAAGGSSSDPMANMTPKQLKSTEESLPIFLGAMWHVSVLDIEKTLTHVTTKVFKDHSVSADERLRRAAAVLTVGRIFMEAAVLSGGSKDPQKKVAEMIALLTPAAGASGADPAASARQEAQKEYAKAVAAQEASSRVDESLLRRKLTLEELRPMSVRQLKDIIAARAVKHAGAVEKDELVQAIFRHQEEHPDAFVTQ